MKKSKHSLSMKRSIEKEVIELQRKKSEANNGNDEESRKVLDPCTIGTSCKSECHVPSSHYRGKSCLKLVSELSGQQQMLLSRRSGLVFNEVSNVCTYHEAIFLTKYDLLQKTCCNPFMKPKHQNRKSLRAIDLATADQAMHVVKADIKPGQKLCPRCASDLAAILRAEDEPTSDGDPDVHMESQEKVNSSFTSLGISPLKFSAVSQRDSYSYARRKINQVQDVVVSEIAQSGSLNTKDLKACEKCKDFDKLMEDLKEKLKVSTTYSQRIQILTLAPNSWTRERIADEFNVSINMVRQARKLKAAEGILAVPQAKMGKKLSGLVLSKVQAFYEDDEYSRVCPGKKDFVSVRIDGKKVQKQKRLLLCNLKELFTAYRAHNGPEIGFSKFCELRPKWCVNVGAAGIHAVCVCMQHQNVKLMLNSSPVQLDYKALMAKIVCNLEAKDCMLHRCERCPGKGILEAHLSSLFEDFDPDDKIDFKQWVHTDRDTLENRQLSIEDFISESSEKIWKLTSHHYIAKHQCAYLRSSKENLKLNELLILMDFAENYSFIVQDAVQGFHWENSQATLHPFVVYHKPPDNNVESLSFCIISDCLRHDTVSVHTFLTRLMLVLKTRFPNLEHIQYFSDGSAAQYKNFKNFINLCYHENDFKVRAQWNFFATSHGKSPCDGIGGTTKRLAARASLQRPSASQILTANDLFAFCDENISGIKFLFVSKDDVESSRSLLEDRFKKGQTVAGTRDNHHFKPVSQSSIQVSRVSGEPASFTAVLYQPETSILGLKVSDLQPGQFVACMYDHRWWIGNINNISISERDALVCFMHPHGPSASFHWPTRNDECWVPEEHIIAVLPAPAATAMGRQYSYPNVITANVEQMFKFLEH